MRQAITKATRARLIQQLQEAPEGYYVSIKAPTRSLAQNSLMWDVLTAISEQVKWDGEYLPAEEWKDLITAALKKQKIRRGLEGGIVVIGARTSQMTIPQMNEVIEYAYAWGVDQGVRFPAQESAA